MTPKPGQRIEITPDTRLGDLIGRRVCVRHARTGNWRTGTIQVVADIKEVFGWDVVVMRGDKEDGNASL